MPDPTTTRVNHVYRQLRDRIGRLPAGMRVASVRQVIREFGVSQATVDRALTKLSEEGLITRRPKRGIYVVEPTRGANDELAGRRTHRIAIAAPDYPSAVTEAFLTALRDHAHRLGEIDRVIRYDWRDRIPQTPPSNGVDALIVIPTGIRLEPGDLYRLSRFAGPVVLIGRCLRDVAIDGVESDNDHAGRLAAQRLIGRGRRRLVILQPEPPGAATDDRTAGFTRQAEVMGVGAVCLIEPGTRPGENSALAAHRALSAWLAEHGGNLDGLFASTDAGALGALRALHDHHLAVPDAVAVVAVGDRPEAALSCPSLTTIRIEYDAIAAEALRVIEHRLAGNREGTIQRAISGTLIERESG